MAHGILSKNGINGEYNLYFMQGRQAFVKTHIQDKVELCGRVLPRTTTTIKRLDNRDLFSRQNGSGPHR